MAKTSELQEGSGWEFLQLTIERGDLIAKKNQKDVDEIWRLWTFKLLDSTKQNVFMFCAEVHQFHEQRTNWTSSRKPIRSANTQRCRHTRTKSKQTLWGVLATSKKQSTRPSP